MVEKILTNAKKITNSSPLYFNTIVIIPSSIIVDDFEWQLIPFIQTLILFSLHISQQAKECFQRFDDFFRITAVYAN